MQCVLGAFCIAYFHSKRSHRHFPSNIDLLKFKRTALRYGTRAPTTECPQAIVVMSLQSIVGVVIQVKFNNKHDENSLINFALQKKLSVKHQVDLEWSALLDIYVLSVWYLCTLFGIYVLLVWYLCTLLGIYVLCLVSMYSLFGIYSSLV